MQEKTTTLPITGMTCAGCVSSVEKGLTRLEGVGEVSVNLATEKAISDEIVVMLQGEVLEQGEKETVLKPPHHAYTELLLSSVPEMNPDWLDHLLAERAGKKNVGHAIPRLGADTY